MNFLFALASFVSAFLLFSIQPMFAKMILPLYGGTAAVWTTCIVFFQATLLAGYCYAHLSSRWLGTRTQIILHAVLLTIAGMTLPISVPQGWTPDYTTEPILSILKLLLREVGLPFFIVSFSSPFLQRFFSLTKAT